MTERQGRRRAEGTFFLSIDRQALVRNKSRHPEDYEPTLMLERSGDEGWETVHMITWEGRGRVKFCRPEDQRPTGARVCLEIKGKVTIWELEDLERDLLP